MGGRMVDVEGVSPEGVLFSAASGEAYADTPAERVALIVSWVRSEDATAAEVVGAIDRANEYLDEDPDDAEAAQAHGRQAQVGGCHVSDR